MLNCLMKFPTTSVACISLMALIYFGLIGIGPGLGIVLAIACIFFVVGGNPGIWFGQRQLSAWQYWVVAQYTVLSAIIWQLLPQYTHQLADQANLIVALTTALLLMPVVASLQFFSMNSILSWVNSKDVV